MFIISLIERKRPTISQCDKIKMFILDIKISPQNTR